MGKVELTDFEREYSYLRYGRSATEFMLDNPKAVQMIKEEAGVVLELAEKEVKRLDSLKEHVSEDLEEASKEWLRPRLDESYANYGEDKMMELTRFDGYAMLDAIEFGAKWKEKEMQSTIELAEDHAMLAGMEKMKEQLMKNAIDGICISNGVVCGSTIDSPAGALFLQHNTFCVGDKVKLIIIKED